MYVIFHNLIPETLLRFIAPLILLVIGVIIEKKYVSRVAMFTNASALFLFYYYISMPTILGVIVNLIIIIGLIGGFARLFYYKLDSLFYKVGWIASSIVTATLLIYGFTF